MIDLFLFDMTVNLQILLLNWSPNFQQVSIFLQVKDAVTLCEFFAWLEKQVMLVI